MSSASERLAEIEARASEFYVVGDAWPNRKKKKLIGEDIPWLLERVRELREALKVIEPLLDAQFDGHANTAEYMEKVGKLNDALNVVRQALADSGEASGD